MSSGYAPRWKRWFLYHIPLLFKRCPEGNFHWRWDRLCHCRVAEHSPGWNGGAYDFKTGKEV